MATEAVSAWLDVGQPDPTRPVHDVMAAAHNTR
jgi:hypothetical protein